MDKLNLKIILSSLFVLSIFVLPSAVSGAVWDWEESLSDSDVVEGMDAIFDDLGLNKNELKYGIQTMNVSRRKKQPPQVSLTFEPANPAPGKKVTVVATPTYFLNDSKDLYFTWFLKNNGCDKDKNPGDSKREKCDHNKDGEIDIEDYKIKAARLLANNDFEWEKDGAYDSHSDSDGYNAHLGGDDQRGKSNHCFIHEISSGDEFEIACGHLFPKAPGFETGDNSFGLDEEKFWRTDPHDPDTADTGNGDEANIAGLGRETFSWVYEEGDQIGVVVEGVSVEPTQYADSSYRIMWAMPKNNCGGINADVTGYPNSKTEVVSVTEDSPNPGETTTITETTTQTASNPTVYYATVTTTIVTTTTVTDSLTGNVISTSSSTTTSETYKNISDDIDITLNGEEIDEAKDLNECLYRNLLSPYEGGGQAQKMEVSLSYSPEFPINDSSGEDEGDQIIVHSSVTNAENTGYLNYSWQVYESDQSNPESWGEPLSRTEIPGSPQTIGMSLDTFRLNMNFSEPKRYLKIKLTVTENVSNRVTREGHNSVVIPVFSTSERIRVFDALVSSSLGLSLSATEHCREGIERAVCPVSKNQIVGLRGPGSGFTDYLWTINGKPLSPLTSNCSAGECNNDNGASLTNIAFFPILEQTRGIYEVTMSAVNQNTGQKISLSKTFQVADPEVFIASADQETCQAALLGNYIDSDGKYWPDYSHDDFLGLAGSQIKLKPVFLGFPAGTPNHFWQVDGLKITADNAANFGYSIDENHILTLTAKEPGQVYNIGLLAIYTQDANTKKALSKYWGASPANFYEDDISKSVGITMVESLNGNTALKNETPAKKIMASAYAGAPEYLLFLLRIVLTGFLMVATAGFVMSFSLENRKVYSDK